MTTKKTATPVVEDTIVETEPVTVEEVTAENRRIVEMLLAAKKNKRIRKFTFVASAAVVGVVTGVILLAKTQPESNENVDTDESDSSED
jgi:hypothetical protein